MTETNKLVKIGHHVINLDAIAAAHWEGAKLFVHFNGGRFLQLVGVEARELFKVFSAGALDVETGELVGA